MDNEGDFISSVEGIEKVEAEELPVSRGEPLAVEKVGQEQIYELVTGDKFGWREIIYDLINTEQLDPWDINIAQLTDKYLDKIRALEEADFVVSSQVLFAASFLLRLKSEILLDKYIRELDDILFGRPEKKKYQMEKIVLAEGEVPELIPRSPIPRLKKVTLQELIESLDQAMKTEGRRIKKQIDIRRARLESEISLPKKRMNIRDSIRHIYASVLSKFKQKKDSQKLSFFDFAGADKESRISTFVPLLHLDNQKKVWLEQPSHFEDIWIWLRQVYEQHRKDTGQLEINEEWDEEHEKKIKELNSAFENPIDEAIEGELADISKDNSEGKIG